MAGMAGGDPGCDRRWKFPAADLCGMNFDQVTLSMTAAGVATLFITQDYLHADAGIACKGNHRNPAISQMSDRDHFDDLATDRHYFYTLFGISRISRGGASTWAGTTGTRKGRATGGISWRRVGRIAGFDTAFALFLARVSRR
jgi:hypothetical protein